MKLSQSRDMSCELQHLKAMQERFLLFSIGLFIIQKSCPMLRNPEMLNRNYHTQITLVTVRMGFSEEPQLTAHTITLKTGAPFSRAGNNRKEIISQIQPYTPKEEEVGKTRLPWLDPQPTSHRLNLSSKLWKPTLKLEEALIA